MRTMVCVGFGSAGGTAGHENLGGFFPPKLFHGSVLRPGLSIPVLTLSASPGSAGDFNLYFSFPAEAGKIDSLATDVPASTVGFFLFLQLRWRSAGDKRISAASLGGRRRKEVVQSSSWRGWELTLIPALALGESCCLWDGDKRGGTGEAVPCAMGFTHAGLSCLQGQGVCPLPTWGTLGSLSPGDPNALVLPLEKSSRLPVAHLLTN